MRCRKAVENLSCILAMNPNSLDDDIGRFFPEDGRDQLYLFTMLGGSFDEDPGPGSAYSFPLTSRLAKFRNRFKSIAMSGSLILFETNWHKTLFCLAWNLLAPGGSLIIPLRSGRKLGEQYTAHGIRLSVIETWLEEQVVVESSSKARFTKGDITEVEVPRSTLAWMADRGPSFVRRSFVRESPVEKRFSDLNIRITDQSFSVANEVGNDYPLVARQVPQGEMRELEYLGVGAGQKFAAWRAAWDRYLDRPSGFSVLDHGSAIGLIPGQAIFEPDMDVSSIAVVEGLDSFSDMAFDFFSYIDPLHRQKISYEFSKAENYRYSQKYHCICFIHMFFLIDMKYREEVFDRAFDSLERNGVVILWEVPKTPASEKAHYYDRMMTTSDIESLCSKYETLATLNPKDMSEVDREKWIDKPLVRVLART